MFNTLGANAVPMPFPELYTALETRAVDGQENTFASIEASKFDEVQKYVSTTNHVYQPLILLFSKKIWDQLSGDERALLLDASTEVQSEARKISRDANEKALVSLRSKGMTVTEVSPDGIAEIREKLKPVTDKHSKEFGEALISEMRMEIEKVRSQK